MRYVHDCVVAKTIREQLHDAWLASGMTQEQLIAKCKLPFTQSGLSRRFSGATPLSTDEAEALARALRIVVTTSREAR
jgi:hypothetical protein